ncbi:carboxyltransferase subunit alpha [Levilactobacillus brevis]|uniref:carboxyltransferase subunit alpha n=1 Tax=Levilactobacillus brevis TaxID=1580 RepID=UPI000FF4253B|nr:carboxyltransferase subunit alpha [Levilactobacillus brevis]RWZ41352.1 acetyl-CoA carboxylase carboxyl transferase subunit alpha [Levilactobacillus brevis]
MVKSAYQTVQAARSQDKITTEALIDGLVTDFFECHGDRVDGDDPTIIGGIGRLNGQPITVIGTRKGRNLTENVARHFGSPMPQGYRKVQRLLQQAEKFGRPVLTLINTPGACPDVASEFHGQGEAIAQCLYQGMQLKVPYISLIFGEGGSGGALALACGDRVYMTVDSIYSVLSPEGYASIMWKDASRVREAAAALALTPQDLKREKVIDDILPEVHTAAELSQLADFLHQQFKILGKLPITTLIDQRQTRFDQY